MKSKFVVLCIGYSDPFVFAKCSATRYYIVTVLQSITPFLGICYTSSQIITKDIHIFLYKYLHNSYQSHKSIEIKKTILIKIIMIIIMIIYISYGHAFNS